jgi:hypothetical protein
MHPDSQNLVAHGIDLFNRCEFFECHEALEEAWTHTQQPERWFLQSLIHFAVGLYHHQRGNTVGATRQLRKGLRKMQAYLPEWGGFRSSEIERDARRCLETIEAGGRVDKFPKITPIGPYYPCRTREGVPVDANSTIGKEHSQAKAPA